MARHATSRHRPFIVTDSNLLTLPSELASESNSISKLPPAYFLQPPDIWLGKLKRARSSRNGQYVSSGTLLAFCASSLRQSTNKKGKCVLSTTERPPYCGQETWQGVSGHKEDFWNYKLILIPIWGVSRLQALSAKCSLQEMPDASALSLSF